MSSASNQVQHKRVMSGMRPTGKLHLGHYVGVLRNWVELQHQYECYFSIVDWHALTTQYDNTEMLQENILNVALDWLASGIDTQKATVFIQSQVPEIAELHLLFSMVTPNKWVETDPTLKDMVTMLRDGVNADLTYGLLGYPILQAADILSVKGSLVPVGKDQLAHLEIARDIVTRFNHTYQSQVFVPPQPLLTQTPLLPGLDGRKMGKSYGNAIYLSETEDETWAKLKQGITDPARIKRTDPGNPENCEVIYKYYQVFASAEAQALAADECRTAARGCMDCKKILLDFVMEEMRPLRERRQALANDLGYVHQLLREGTEKARATCQDTMREVRSVMKLYQLTL